MKSLLIFLAVVMSGRAMAQYPCVVVQPVPVASVVQVPVMRPVVVQEIRYWPVIENRVVYQQVWPVYQYSPMPVVYPVIDQRPYRCGFFRWY